MSDPILWTEIGPEPLKDRQIRNAVLISLLTELGYAGNRLVGTKEAVGSLFLRETQGTPITVSRLRDMEKAARTDLAWVVRTGLAQSLTVTVTNPRTEELAVQVEAILSGGRKLQLALSSSGGRWAVERPTEGPDDLPTILEVLRWQ